MVRDSVMKLNLYAPFAPQYAALPINETQVDLNQNNLETLSSAQLISVIQAIPARFTSVNLSFNFLRIHTGAALAAAFSTLHQGITELDLSDNELGDANCDDLITAFNSIPATVTIIDLGNNNLSKFAEDELGLIFGALNHIQLRVLGLEGNRLGELADEELREGFSAIPRTVRGLNLGYNELGLHDHWGLNPSFSSLPPGLRTLGLAGNYLGSLTNLELADIFRTIPRSITSLDLSHNELDTRSGEQLSVAFVELPKYIISLNLAFNFLSASAETVDVLSSLSETVTQLNLAYNCLFLSIGTCFHPNTGLNNQLVEIFKAFPPRVVTINLMENKMAKKTEAEWYQLLTRLPKTVTELIIDDALQAKIIKMLKMIRVQALNTICSTAKCSPSIGNLVLSYSSCSNLLLWANNTSVLPQAKTKICDITAHVDPQATPWPNGTILL